MGEGSSDFLGGAIFKLRDLFYELKNSLGSFPGIDDLLEIGRRYAITNSFDSVLTMLGILLASYSTGVSDPAIVMGLLLAGAGSIFLSGFIGTYISERAEREFKVRELEKAVMMALSETFIGKMERRKAILIALVSGAVPSFAVSLLVVPFYICSLGLMGLQLSYISSMVEALSLLLIIGAYLGSVAGGNRLIYALSTLGAGLLLVVMAIWLGIK